MSDQPEQIDIINGLRCDDLECRIMACIERAEAERGIADYNDADWLTLATGDLTLMRAKLALQPPAPGEVTGAIINAAATLLRWIENRRRRYLLAHGCRHAFSSWCEGSLDHCLWCGLPFGSDVQPKYRPAVEEGGMDYVSVNVSMV